MNAIQLHLALNHIPLMGTFFGLILFLTAVMWKSEDLRRFALYYFIGLGIATILVFLTGEPAEELLEGAPGFSEQKIGKHEDASKLGLVVVEIVAVLSVAAVFLKQLKLPARSWFPKIFLLLIVVALSLMGWTSRLGGKIHHDEIDQPPARESGS